jgi:signal transduction histidine kinase
MYSLRRTLAVRFSLTLFVALLLIAMLAYAGAQRLLREELDRDLLTAAELELGFVRTGFPILPYPGDFTREEFVGLLNRFVTVRAFPDSILATNTTLANELPVDHSAIMRAFAGAQVWTTQQWEGDDIRAVYTPVASPDGSDLIVIQVAASLGPHRAASRELLLMMLGTVLLGTLATASGSFWLARSVVAPVYAIAAEARAIAPATRSQRITAHADVRELQGLVQILNQMLARLDTAFESQRRLIADAGHDLRTPLTAMRGELEVVLRSAREPERYHSVLQSQLEEVDHLISISDSLILLARLDAGELSPQRTATNLSDFVAASVDRARTRAGDRAIEVDLPDSVSANIDPSMFTVVLDQLLDNGIQHTDPGTRIRVSTSENGEAIVTVEDAGQGIPEDALPHMFDRFYRADTSRTRGNGAGLGLSIAAAIVHAHDGTIAAGPSALGGLAVTIRLPQT